MVTTVLAVLAFVAGALLVATTVLSAIMTLVVPRALPVTITRWVFVSMRALFWLRGRRARSFEERDRVLALYGPISLFTLAATWLVLTGTGYMLMFWSLGERPLRQALVLSGSSIYTLGFRGAREPADHGAGLLRGRVRPGPAGPAERGRPADPLVDHRRLGSAGGPVAGVGELVRRRRRDPHLPAGPGVLPLAALGALMVTASGAVLDGASLLASTVDRPRSPDAELCIRAGYVALRRIADFFYVRHTPTRTGRRTDLDRPARVRPGLPAAGRGRGAAQGRPRPGVA